VGRRAVNKSRPHTDIVPPGSASGQLATRTAEGRSSPGTWLKARPASKFAPPSLPLANSAFSEGRRLSSSSRLGAWRARRIAATRLPTVVSSLSPPSLQGARGMAGFGTSTESGGAERSSGGHALVSTRMSHLAQAEVQRSLINTAHLYFKLLIAGF
jgi:hypothetical protein